MDVSLIGRVVQAFYVGVCNDGLADRRVFPRRPGVSLTQHVVWFCGARGVHVLSMPQAISTALLPKGWSAIHAQAERRNSPRCDSCRCCAADFINAVIDLLVIQGHVENVRSHGDHALFVVSSFLWIQATQGHGRLRFTSSAVDAA